MIAFLAGPLGKYALIGAAVVALLIGGGWYLHSVKQAGVTQERTAEAARGAAHELTIERNGAAVDAAVARDADPSATLHKDWSVKP